MPENTVRVGSVSLQATEDDIRDFFTFSGEITHIELQREGDWSKVAFVTFKNADALETALLLSGATIVDKPVSIIRMEGYVLPRDNQESDDELDSHHEESVAAQPPTENRAQVVITEMLAKGFLLGKDAMSKAKQFDEKHGLTATAAATVSSVNTKLGLTEKITAGTSVVNQQLKDVDEKYQISGKTKSAFAVAEEKVNIASSAIMKNRYVLTGASWVTGAFNKVAKAAAEAGQKVKEKAASSEGQREGGAHDPGYPYGDGYSRVRSTEPAAVSLSSAAENAPVRYPSSRGYEAPLQAYSGQVGGGETTKPSPAQGLVL